MDKMARSPPKWLTRVERWRHSTQGNLRSTLYRMSRMRTHTRTHRICLVFLARQHGDWHLTQLLADLAVDCRSEFNDVSGGLVASLKRRKAPTGHALAPDCGHRRRKLGDYGAEDEGQTGQPGQPGQDWAFAGPLTI